MTTTPPAGASPRLTPPLMESPWRTAITAATRVPEPELMPVLVAQAQANPELEARTQTLALRLAEGLRRQTGTGTGRAGLVQGLLQEFALSSQEGVALMCLAEALLRIPDDATRDALIRDKISAGNWHAHLGQSPSLFVNAASWGLLITGKLVATHSDNGLSHALRRILGRGGEPLIRRGVDMAMRMMGEQFVTGQTIGQALQHAATREPQGFRYSFDMLGEAAFTEADAQRYFAAYRHAIEAIGQASAGRGVIEGPGISIKLSALHPRYSRAQVARVKAEAYPRLLSLVKLARAQDIGLNIDAEEADRLELSLDLLEMLCFEPALAGWNGIGFVIQAYQKRCPAVIDYLADLAGRSHHRLMVRLVKGAYWDSEIKRAQVDGLSGYPVYTRKAHTDVAYLACARQLLAAPDAFYPQFATHNAQTLAAIHEFAGPQASASAYEFQCLHGMGEPLYEQVVRPVGKGGLARPCRIYAPVGPHETLLAYLVRRLLENGANTSFVNRVANENIALTELVQDPVAAVKASAQVEGALGLPHPGIALPAQLFGRERVNAEGCDLACETTLAWLAAEPGETTHEAAPMLACAVQGEAPVAIVNPAQYQDRVGTVTDATLADCQAALACAEQAAPPWADTPATERAAALERAANGLEAQTAQVLNLLVREAGKTHANAVAELREAVDFLRYYAAQARTHLRSPQVQALGPVVCISPWNFPLAIFTGQVAASLAAGNVVLAKPAEQTPLIAALAVRALHAAGVPRAALQLLPGRGEVVGAALVGDARVQGVLFTGSTEVARILQRTLAQRLGAHGQPVPLVAETGGQNAMVVDSSALAEQVVADVLASAFDSAGQRCSALRMLCLQEEAAPRVLEMLINAMRELRLGDPRALVVDVGPVIDAQAQAGLLAHIDALRAKGRRVHQPVPWDANQAASGFFVPPTVIEIESVGELQHEVFGPVLHVLRYPRAGLDAVLAAINATGYGLTFGVHTRIDETVAQVVSQVQAGNVYVNRNMVGAVVGVQPFGGEGLSGTGPKAGGPLALLRLLAHAPQALARQCVQASGEAMSWRPIELLYTPPPSRLEALAQWARTQGHPSVVNACAELGRNTPLGQDRLLPGPTGESNRYLIGAREAVLCLADAPGDVLLQTATVFALGARAVWPASWAGLWENLSPELREGVALAGDWQALQVHFDAVLHHGSPDSLKAVNQALARRAGAMVQVQNQPSGSAAFALERLVVERSISANTAAAGGNASLMTMG
jgi:RHH-type transcriptional regulator, proline utilization regulon repressor / proline dehydrogenase / delta 1-pyrroline-5-carboxylate dehydrogenase